MINEYSFIMKLIQNLNAVAWDHQSKCNNSDCKIQVVLIYYAARALAIQHRLHDKEKEIFFKMSWPI